MMNNNLTIIEIWQTKHKFLHTCMYAKTYLVNECKRRIRVRSFASYFPASLLSSLIEFPLFIAVLDLNKHATIHIIFFYDIKVCKSELLAYLQH